MEADFSLRWKQQRIGASKKRFSRQDRDGLSIPDFRANGVTGKRGTGPRISAMGVTVRSYNPADFALLYKLDQKCFPPGIAYSKTILKYFLAQAGAECLLAEDDGKIAAFILTEENPPLAHVITLDVDASHRRNGIGTRLLRASEENLAVRGVRTVLLETATTNEAGVAFWKRHGYRIEAVLKNYYPGHLDAYEMRKPLPAAGDKHT